MDSVETLPIKRVTKEEGSSSIQELVAREFPVVYQFESICDAWALTMLERWFTI